MGAIVNYNSTRKPSNIILFLLNLCGMVGLILPCYRIPILEHMLNQKASMSVPKLINSLIQLNEVDKNNFYRILVDLFGNQNVVVIGLCIILSVFGICVFETLRFCYELSFYDSSMTTYQHGKSTMISFILFAFINCIVALTVNGRLNEWGNENIGISLGRMEYFAIDYGTYVLLGVGVIGIIINQCILRAFEYDMFRAKVEYS